MADAAPAAVETAAPVATVAPVAAPVTDEPKETPAQSPGVKRANRMAQVKEAMVARDAAAKAKEPAKEAAPAPVADAKETPKETAKEPEAAKEAGKAKAWADVMERESRARQERETAKREREQIMRERAAFDAERKSAQEASELLARDPVAYAAKFGGKDFGKKLVDYTLDEKTRTADQQSAKIAEIDSKLEQLARAQQEKEVQGKVSEYIATHRAHWKTDADSAVLNAWYEESEIEPVVHSIAERHATATREVLTPARLASNLRNELKSRLERLAKTEAGQEFLKQFVTGATPAPAKSRPPAEAPKTLSKDLTTQGMPPGDGRLRKLSGKDRSDMIRQLLERRQG